MKNLLGPAMGPYQQYLRASDEELRQSIRDLAGATNATALNRIAMASILLRERRESRELNARMTAAQPLN